MRIYLTIKGAFKIFSSNGVKIPSFPNKDF